MGVSDFFLLVHSRCFTQTLVLVSFFHFFTNLILTRARERTPLRLSHGKHINPWIDMDMDMNIFQVGMVVNECLSIAHDIKRMCQVQTIQTRCKIQTHYTPNPKWIQKKNTHIIWLIQMIVVLFFWDLLYVGSLRPSRTTFCIQKHKLLQINRNE